VHNDFMGGIRSGVNGTPAFFINGVRHDGPYDYASLAGGNPDARRSQYAHLTDLRSGPLGTRRRFDKAPAN
jgi:hypothetical protein